jgi:hypothetical protein
MQLRSPLLEVYRATRAPGAFRELGGVVVWWRLTVHGPDGAAIGVREVTHVADCAALARDRLEHQDGRAFGRIDGQVFATRKGMPWATLADEARPELALFGLQLRWPWCFGDENAFAVLRHDVSERGGERLGRIVLERRPPADRDVFGPEADPTPRDRFELLFEPSTGLPRELVHRLAEGAGTRRLLFEDWRDVGGVRLPHRRVYVDEALQPTTTLEILRIERQPVGDGTFRLR